MQDKRKRPAKKVPVSGVHACPRHACHQRKTVSHKPKSMPPSSWQKKDSPQANQSARQGSKSDPWDHPGAWRLEWLGGEAGCIDVRAPDSHYSYGQFAVSAQIDRRRATILFRRHKVDGGVRFLWGGSRPCPTGRDGDQEVMAMLCTKLRCGSFPRPQSLRGPS
jgi:hypothetical protein